jgi:hypothetical protein
MGPSSDLTLNGSPSFNGSPPVSAVDGAGNAEEPIRSRNGLLRSTGFVIGDDRAIA